MIMVIGIFVACILAMFAAIWVYNKSEDTAFHDTKLRITELEMVLDTNEDKVKKLEELLNSNINTVASSNLKVMELEKQVEALKNIVRRIEQKTGDEVSGLQEHCAKLREGQIGLQEKLSRKEQTTTIKGPIEVEVRHSKPMPKKKLLKSTKKSA